MPVWIITGCSSGFGWEMTLDAIAKGIHVIATCRSPVSRLADLEKAGAITLELDITAPIEQHKDFAKKVLESDVVKKNGGVDVLLHNAGYIQLGGVEEVTEEQYIKSFNTNFFGHLKLTQAFLPHFRSRREGIICFVGSIVGFTAFPGGSAYSSSKYAMAGLVEALSVELETFNLTVTCIEPGYFRTNIFKGARPGAPATVIPEYESTIVGDKRRLFNDDFKQLGDSWIGSQKIVDILRGEWPAHLKGTNTKLPTRIVLGDDGYQLVKDWLGKRVKENEDWKEWITGTTYAA